MYGNCQRLLAVVRASDLRSLRALLRKGDLRRSDLNVALIGAARRGWVPGLRLLLRAGASAGAADRYGTTALHHAVRRGRAVVVALLDAGAEPGRPDKSGNTPLIEAALAGNAGITRAMLTKNCAIDRRNRLGETALSSAAAWGWVSVIRLLLKAGANPNIGDRRGGTPLMLSAMRGDLAAIHSLLGAGALPGATDDSGNSATTHAEWYGHKAVAGVLRRARGSGGGCANRKTGRACSARSHKVVFNK